jgi:hypothetical protein
MQLFKKIHIGKFLLLVVLLSFSTTKAQQYLISPPYFYYDGTNTIQGKMVTGLANQYLTIDPTGTSLKFIDAVNSTTIVKKSTNYTILPSDNTILADATTAAFTLTLPPANTNLGKILIIRKIDESANVLTFSSPIKISETTSFTTLNINTTIRIQSDGTAWYKID